MEMNVKEAKQRVESLQKLKKNLDTLHHQIFQLQEAFPATKDTVILCDGSIVDAIAYLSDYESVLANAIDNAEITL